MTNAKILLCAFLIIGTATWAPIGVITEEGMNVGMMIDSTEVYLRTSGYSLRFKTLGTDKLEFTLLDDAFGDEQQITTSEKEISDFINKLKVHPAYDVDSPNPEERKYKFATGIYPNGPRIGRIYLELNQHSQIDDFSKDIDFDTRSLDAYLARVESKLDGGKIPLSNYFISQLRSILHYLYDSRIGPSQITIPKLIMCALLGEARTDLINSILSSLNNRQQEILVSITSLYRDPNDWYHKLKPTQERLDQVWNIGVTEGLWSPSIRPCSPAGRCWSADSITIKFEGRTRIGRAAGRVVENFKGLSIFQ